MRTSRYEGLVNVKRLEETVVAVVGCGALGRQVAMTLAVMGTKRFILFDPDIVEEVNLGTQGWSPDDLGLYKVSALRGDLIRATGGSLEVLTPTVERYTQMRFEGAVRDLEGGDVAVVLAVDSLDARKFIASSIGGKGVGPLHPLVGRRVRLLLDGRMGGHSWEVHTALVPDGIDRYLSTVGTDAQAPEGRCTERGTFPLALVTAGMLVGQYVAWLNGGEPLESMAGSLLVHGVAMPQ